MEKVYLELLIVDYAVNLAYRLVERKLLFPPAK